MQLHSGLLFVLLGILKLNEKNVIMKKTMIGTKDDFFLYRERNTGESFAGKTVCAARE